MVKKFLKFIDKSPYRDRLLKVVKDIYTDNLDWYDIKRIHWKESTRRLRVWNIRFVIKKTQHWNQIMEVNNRGDIY